MNRSGRTILIVSTTGILGVIVSLLLHFTILGVMVQAVILELMPGKLGTFLIAGSAMVLVLLCLSRRKRTWLIPALALLYFVGIVPSNIALWKARDTCRHDRMDRLHQRLDEFTATGNPLPDELASIPELSTLLTGPFGLDKIRYRSNNGKYIIESSTPPIGPTELYSSDRNEWYYEE